MEDHRTSHDPEREHHEILSASLKVRNEARKLIAQARELRSTAESTRRYVIRRWHDPPDPDSNRNGDGNGHRHAPDGTSPDVSRSKFDE